jgi:hypothetical protein
VKLPDQRSGLPGKVLGHFHIASLDPDRRSGLAESGPVNKHSKNIVAFERVAVYTAIRKG